MKVSFGNKLLACVFLGLSFLYVFDTSNNSFTKERQPTELLEHIAKRGIPKCGEPTARYRLGDAQAGIFKELTPFDRERVSEGLITDEGVESAMLGTPKAVVFIGRYDMQKIPKLNGLPMFLLFLPAGGEGVCLRGMFVGRLAIHEEIARLYENR